MEAKISWNFYLFDSDFSGNALCVIDKTLFILLQGTIDQDEMIEILINIFGEDKCGFSMSREEATGRAEAIFKTSAKEEFTEEELIEYCLADPDLRALL